MKHKLKLIYLIWFFVYLSSCQAQTNSNSNLANCTDCNLKNAQGKKYGLWIEAKGNTEIYYKNNLRDGLYKMYNRKNGKVLCLGEFKEGNKSGKWFFFNESSHLLFTEENIKENKEYTKTGDDGVKVTPKFTSYVKNYYLNGMIKEEGQVLYDEDIEIDFYKTGIWRYYDNEGNLKETKDEG